MIEFAQYAKVHQKYCIAYFGVNGSTIDKLVQMRPIIEEALPGIEIHIACSDELSYLAERHDRIITRSKLKIRQHEYGYVREIAGNPDYLLGELVKKPK